MNGFAHANLAVNMLHDPKFNALWVLCSRTQSLMDAAVTIYLATVLDSWAQGERVAAVAPFWAEYSDAAIKALIAAKLLDRHGRVPIKTWEKWFGAAATRRRGSSVIASIAGKASAAARKASTVSQQSVDSQLTVSQPVTVTVTDKESLGIVGDKSPPIPPDPREEEASWLKSVLDDDEPDPVIQWRKLVGRMPSDNGRHWIEQLAAEHGPAPVERAMAAEHHQDRTPATLLERTANRLREEAYLAQKRRRAEPRPRRETTVERIERERAEMARREMEGQAHA